MVSIKEYKTRHDWMEKVIHWELDEKLKFDDTSKCYLHKPESAIENSLGFWDTNESSNPGKKTKLRLKNISSSEYCHFSWQLSKNIRKQNDKQIIARELKKKKKEKLCNMKITMTQIVFGAFGTGAKGW